MAVESQVSDDQKSLTIKVRNRFDFSRQREFRNAYCNYNDSSMAFYVDLSSTDYMDSSALGMLLLLKEHADAINGSVSLVRPADTIRKIIMMANFDKLFTIGD